MAKRNWDTFQFPGGILNRIHRIVMRTGGKSIGHYNDLRTGTSSDPHSVIERTTSEPPEAPSQNDTTKANDV